MKNALFLQMNVTSMSEQAIIIIINHGTNDSRNQESKTSCDCANLAGPAWLG